MMILLSSVLFFLTVVTGAVILRKIAVKKWGYTEKREWELEKKNM